MIVLCIISIPSFSLSYASYELCLDKILNGSQKGNANYDREIQ